MPIGPCNEFESWLWSHRIRWVPVSWAWRVVGVSRAAVAKAIREDRLRVVSFPASPDVRMVSLQELERWKLTLRRRFPRRKISKYHW